MTQPSSTYRNYPAHKQVYFRARNARQGDSAFNMAVDPMKGGGGAVPTGIGGRLADPPPSGRDRPVRLNSWTRIFGLNRRYRNTGEAGTGDSRGRNRAKSPEKGRRFHEPPGETLGRL